MDWYSLEWRCSKHAFLCQGIDPRGHRLVKEGYTKHFRYLHHVALDDQDEILRRAVQCFKGKNWKKIGASFVATALCLSAVHQVYEISSVGSFTCHCGHS